MGVVGSLLDLLECFSDTYFGQRLVTLSYDFNSIVIRTLDVMGHWRASGELINLTDPDQDSFATQPSCLPVRGVATSELTLIAPQLQLFWVPHGCNSLYGDIRSYRPHVSEFFPFVV